MIKLFRNKEFSSGLFKYFKNASWLLAGQATSLAASFFVGLFVARNLGPEKYGILSYALSFSGIFTFISSLGVDGILSRELVKDRKKEEESFILGSSFLLKVIGSVISLILCVFSVFCLPDQYGYRKMIFWSFPLVIFQFVNIFSLWFQSRVGGKWISLAQIFSVVLLAFVKLILIYSNAPLGWVVLSYSLDISLFGVFSYFFYIRCGGNILWRSSKKLCLKILNESWPIMISSASCVLLFKIDQVMVGQIMGSVAAGYYAAAIKLSEIWYFFPVLISNSFSPALVNAFKLNIKTYYRRRRYLYSFLFFSAVFMAVFVSLFSDFLIYFLFGSEFIQSAEIAKIYVWSSVGMFIGTGMWVSLVVEGKNKIILKTYSMALFLNIILNFFLIKYNGLTGAAWASVISYSTIPILVYYFGKQKR